MIIFLAGLQGVPWSLHEAAAIDGASAWQRFRHITLPLLRPTLLFVSRDHRASATCSSSRSRS